MPGFLLDISPALEYNIFPGKLRSHFIYPWCLRKFKIIEFSENFVSFLNKYVELVFLVFLGKDTEDTFPCL